MKKNKDDIHGKVLDLSEHLSEKKKAKNIIEALKDSKKVAGAVEKRICMVCNKTRICVNKTGLCAFCYAELTPEQKRVAEDEAKHKKVFLRVTDDRWDKADDH